MNLAADRDQFPLRPFFEALSAAFVPIKPRWRTDGPDATETEMTTSTGDAARCPSCSNPLPAGSLHGLCAACLWGAMDDVPPEAGEGPAALLRLPGLNLMEVIDRGGMGIVPSTSPSGLISSSPSAD